MLNGAFNKAGTISGASSDFYTSEGEGFKGTAKEILKFP